METDRFLAVAAGVLQISGTPFQTILDKHIS